MSPNPWPVPTPFDPESDVLPPALDVLADRTGRMPALLLVAGAEARSDGWAARTATTLASRFGDEGQRIVLAELSADEPELHEELGVPNDEGMADVFLFGASLRRVARAVSGRTFYFAPAGEYVPDAGELLSHARWERLIGGFVEAEAVLLVYVPAGTPGLDTLARRAGHAVVLAAADEADAIAGSLPDACGIDAVLTVPDADASPAFSPADDGPVVERVGDASAPVPEDDAADTALDEVAGDAAQPAFDARAGPESGVERGGFAAPEEVGAAVDAAGADESADGPDATRAGAARGGVPAGVGMHPTADIPVEDDLIRELAAIHRESKSRRWRIVLLGTILVAAAVVAGWFVYGRSDEGAAPAPPADTAADAFEAAVQPPRPVDSPVPYSVVIESHQDLGSAQDAVARLRAEEPEIGFYLAPVRVDDVVYFRVLAGPAPDSAAAGSLLRRLVDLGLKEEAEPWAVRNTAYAHHLADFDTRDAAAARTRELAEAGVPAYVVEVPFTAGPSRFRIYAGAYRNETEASVMTRILSEHGLGSELVLRIGRPAS